MEVDSAAKVLLLVVIGLATGGLTGLTGASGMSILISGLLMVGCEIREVIGLTFLVTLVNSLTSVIPYWRRQLVDQRMAAALAVPAVVGVFAGHQLAEAVPDTWLQTVMLVALFVAGARITLSRSMEQETGRPPRRPAISLVILLGVVIGLIMGGMGGGGGRFIGAVLVIAFR
ncbi:MAG: sulfite exporter TauE/SafE family protein, partial [Planctomycetota bacterium]|nr:sulfite exporter TauE/SafE family protein [Planctomycetota bacterium]